MARSLNKVELIGNLTKDPELRYTPQGTAVCTFSIATNRQWTTDNGEKKEDVEFHRVVAWNKLAELCGQLLGKGRKVYVEGRLQTRKWTGQDGADHFMTEVIINDMIILDSRGGAGGNDFSDIPEDALSGAPVFDEGSPASSGSKSEDKPKKGSASEVSDDDIPF